jgi:hypothetical protein
MPKTSIYYPPIGISGAALVGKDTLSNLFIDCFKKLYNIKAERNSIAGDTIRKDLKGLILKKMGKEVDLNDAEEKTLIRPLMVEYGRFMRNKTKGRYFIEELEKNKSFGRNYIPIIPDIRYTEFEKDENHWLKQEKKGILIFLKRKGVKPANHFEEINNLVLEKEADFVIDVPNFEGNGSFLNDYIEYMDEIVNNIITIYLQGISRLSNKS